MVTYAGVGFTTLGNATLTSMLKYELVPEAIRPFTAATSLMMMVDRHYYLWSTGIKNFARIDIKSFNDIHKIMRFHFNEKNLDLAYGIAMSVSALELFLRREELGYLINTALGKPAEIPRGIEDLNPFFYMSDKALIVGLQGEL
ncbi:MAG: hypothetical protein Q8R47_03170 [Nanoarchaeota archaeon]|nr:hypothetical protein [Nanoarchaeota archaeon]